VKTGEWEAVFEDWLAGKARISERLMLDIRVERQGKTIFETAAMNDAVISASGIAKTIRLRAMHGENTLARYRSDGLILATPTGSTAYCASAGGPLLDPEMDAMILNPICPFMLLQRPLVIPPDELITVNIEEHRSGVLLTIDGQVTEALESADKVLVTKHPHKARLLCADRAAFYRALHTKLAWAGQPADGEV
jgi:NAD+ kinase